MLDHVPRFTTDAAARIARELYDLDATATPLPSERDQNFLLTTPDGPRAVLKIANAREDRAMLDAQQQALAHLATTVDVVPRPIPTLAGEAFADVGAPDGPRHLVWAVTHRPGVPLARARRRSPALLEDLGRRAGELARGLATFDHPAIHRDFHWDLARARHVVAEHRALLDDALGADVDAVMARFDAETAPLLASLRRSALHGDLNDHNVLVLDGADPWTRGQRVTGIVDLGDMVHGWTAGDLAIAAAYVMTEADDPLAAAASLVRGCHATFPLEEPEIDALFGLALMRLAASACLAAHQRRQRPENAYLDVSQSAIRRALPRLARIPFRLAAAVFRDACGLEPVPSSARVRAWLAAHTGQFAPVLGVDLRRDPCVVLDLSVGSPLVSGDPRDNAEPALTQRIADVSRGGAEGAETPNELVFSASSAAPHEAIAIGRWDEPRLLYTAPFFVTPDGEPRTIHIGLDLFAPAGTPVYAPLDGTVHAFADNHVVQDYGPVIVLRHATDDGTAFFALYGHLSRASLDGLAVGRRIARGERFASLGTPEENVGWTPHLHLQIITDPLALGTDFPGVAPASQRAVWRSLSPDPNLIVGVPAERFPPPTPAKRETLAQRRRRFPANLSLAYREPLRIVRGWMQHVYDDEGRRFLDAYNNVPHVGHCHPRVVRAVQAQAAVLNTNTRYLSDRAVTFAERLAATLPEGLEVCAFVNSASEANELALRLARAYTGRRETIVLEAAYHGNTTSLVDISPYKHAGPGGTGTPDWVRVAPLPDVYRGPYRRDDPTAATKYAGHVAQIARELVDEGRGVAAFIAETCPSVGGQLVLPAGYLAEVYRHVRAAGGVCIADEVQTGLGRMGTHCWAFEAHDVVPDIVVIGKPLGNGHPVAAVVTTRAIADAFDNGMEYFSTFGGNDVSCAAGLAVLDVLRDEGLQAHAHAVGERLLAGLRPLIARYPIVGDVRGSGLFLGAELVRDRETLEPAGEEASFVANRFRELGILLGTDGPWHNVVKIRPPMPFGFSDADRLVETFERILGEDFS
ncbi:aminotransferase class-III [Gemmatirosa kalamazoonensis]|uniref:Aminotransferase class-III n=1 Tax=Gemmatirosa kalamazoonensis TaxID=861299 RepID=W0RFA7_9BACT|nr:aminotransferase class III-fold pyridoxal phosphate-dependent enzyme [Gemmatirosa kalamazoonensis]AHG88068.1 aminotransferase class-III [Gemmatirosa kalamazoonensis]